jgi:hypothetical protein
MEDPVERSTSQLIRKMSNDMPALDTRLPAWARRSNPIVRRHLGVYVKTIPPQLDTLLNLYLIQSAIILLSVPFPFIFNVTLPLITVAILLLPASFFLYAQMLFIIIDHAAILMLKEFRDDTITLLRTTPMSPQQIILGKIASALWRRVDDLSLILLSAALFSVPPIILEIAQLWPPDKNPYLTQFGIIIVFGASLLRLLLEPFMVAALGVLVGAAVPVRSSALTAGVLLIIFYFLLINLPRLLPLSYPMRIFIEGVLPVALPLLITWLSIHYAADLMTRD